MLIKKLMIAASLVFIGLSSCKKESSIPKPVLASKALAGSSRLMGLPGTGTSPGQGTPISFSNGQYVCPYGGGIQYGGSFPYPLNVSTSLNGTLYAPETPGYSPNSMISFTQVGPHFTMLLNTIVGGYNTNPRAVAEYNDAFSKYANGWTLNNYQGVPTYEQSVALVGGNSSGVLTITGSYIIDTSSPTNIAIVPLRLTSGVLVE